MAEPEGGDDAGAYGTPAHSIPSLESTNSVQGRLNVGTMLLLIALLDVGKTCSTFWHSLRGTLAQEGLTKFYNSCNGNIP